MQRQCPCVDCEHSFVVARTWQRHAAQLATGERASAPPAGLPGASPPLGSESDSEAVESGSDSESGPRVPQVLDGFCMDLVDLVARNQVGVTGMENVLKILDKHIKKHLDPEIADLLPHSMWTLTAEAMEISGAGCGCRTFYRHFCPECGEIFPEDANITVCSTRAGTPKHCKGKRYTKAGTLRVKALYYDLRDKLGRLAKDGFLKGFLTRPSPPPCQGSVGNRDLQDVFDGTIIDELRVLWPELHVLYLAMVHPPSHA
jgi:hypothetical protein